MSTHYLIAPNIGAGNGGDKGFICPPKMRESGGKRRENYQQARSLLHAGVILLMTGSSLLKRIPTHAHENLHRLAEMPLSIHGSTCALSPTA